MSVRIISWNVNGYRAGWKKGFPDWLKEDSPDIVCIQETKAWPEQLTEEQLAPHGYHSAFTQAEKKGYSGVATFSKVEPDSVQVGFGDPEWDTEGRVVITEHFGGKLVLANIYFPNGKRDKGRLKYKMDFYAKTQDYFTKLTKAGRHVIVCGDVNTAHKPIDLSRPKENETTSGFLPEERAWIDGFLDAGFLDTFRIFSPEEPDRYSWWDQITRARERNVGWRIDYHFASESLREALVGAEIHDQVMGSDHCPVSVTLNPEKF